MKNDDLASSSSSAHWETVYRTKSDQETSWFQEQSTTSLKLVREFAPRGGRIIDVGGGQSSLAGQLAHDGFDVTVLDISAAAIERAQQRNHAQRDRIRWIVGDVLDDALTLEASDGAGFDIWHDRAVFHFLTSGDDQRKYVARVTSAVRAGGHVVIATFALDGPEKCSGLPVQRYDAGGLQDAFGPQFSVLKSFNETHITPWGKPQQFCVAVLRHVHIR